MKANPGGQLPINEIIGRDEIVKRLWDILSRQSIVLCAERRMGKTCVLTKLRGEAVSGLRILYRDLEGVHAPLEFAESIFNDVEQFLSRTKKLAGKTRALLKHLSGMEVGGLVKFPDAVANNWKELLEKSLADLFEGQEEQVIFLWDELPTMLDNIRKEAGENAATEILDVLRSLRHTYPNLRMVYTGSIGLHHVLASFKRTGYSNAPTNDMLAFELDPLRPEHGELLASRLLEGEGISVQNPMELAQCISLSVGHIPFYIHHIVDKMKAGGGVMSANEVDRIIVRCLVDPGDPWHMMHYRDRVDTYYQPVERPIVLAILDILATTDAGTPFARLFDLLKAKEQTEDKEGVRSLLILLKRDHYVAQETDGTYTFRYPLIKRWWKLHRGL